MIIQIFDTRALVITILLSAERYAIRLPPELWQGIFEFWHLADFSLDNT